MPALTVQSLVDQALMVAKAGIGEAAQPLFDDQATVELLVGRAVRKLSEKLASKPEYAYLMRSRQDVVFAAGEATVPSNVLSRYLGSAELKRTQQAGLNSRVVQWLTSEAQWDGWLEPGFLYGLQRTGKFLVKEANGANFVGTLNLDAAVQLSDAALTNFPHTVNDNLVAELAEMIRDFAAVAEK